MTEVRAWLCRDKHDPYWVTYQPTDAFDDVIPITINPDAPPGQRVREVVETQNFGQFSIAPEAPVNPASQANPCSMCGGADPVHYTSCVTLQKPMPLQDFSKWNPFKPKPKVDADGWIPWAGGECPVPKDTVIEIMLRDGHVGKASAGLANWSDGLADFTITAYRIVDSAHAGEGETSRTTDTVPERVASLKPETPNAPSPAPAVSLRDIIKGQAIIMRALAFVLESGTVGRYQISQELREYADEFMRLREKEGGQ